MDVPAVSVRSIASFAGEELEEALPWKEATHGDKEKAQARNGDLVDKGTSISATVGLASKDCEG